MVMSEFSIFRGAHDTSVNNQYLVFSGGSLAKLEQLQGLKVYWELRVV